MGIFQQTGQSLQRKLYNFICYGGFENIVGDKPYFILTSNGEGHFEMSGFEPQRYMSLRETGLSCVAAGYVTIKHILHFQSFGNWQKLKKTAWFLRNFFPNVRFVVLQWIYITHSLQSRKYKWNGKSSAKIFIIRKQYSGTWYWLEKSANKSTSYANDCK